MSYGPQRKPAAFSSRVPAGLLALALLGCAGEASSAQEPAPAGRTAGPEGQAVELPSQQSVLINRADQARIKGSPDAPLRILEISDFQCPFCARFNTETLPLLDSLYVQTGKVEYVWISFVNPRHELAWPAIEAAFCAGSVGKFWPMHDILFDRQGEWSTSDAAFDLFVDYASEINIDRESFATCLRDDRTAPLQVRDFQSVSGAGISSTPFFIIADSLSIRGAAPAEQFRSVIDSLLAARGEL